MKDNSPPFFLDILEVPMFEKIKSKLVRTAKAEVSKEIEKSANEGTIHTGAVIAELVIFAGFIFVVSHGNPKTAAQTTQIIFKNCNIIIK